MTWAMERLVFSATIFAMVSCSAMILPNSRSKLRLCTVPLPSTPPLAHPPPFLVATLPTWEPGKGGCRV